MELWLLDTLRPGNIFQHAARLFEAGRFYAVWKRRQAEGGRRENDMLGREEIADGLTFLRGAIVKDGQSVVLQRGALEIATRLSERDC